MTNPTLPPVTREFWEQRYAKPGFAYGTEPNRYLVSRANLFSPTTSVLAVGDGEGRNGVWLADQGADVLSIDQSETGLTKARQLAAERGVSLRTETVDLLSWQWPEAEFDRVVTIFIHFPPAHRAAMHQAMLRALKPGGLLLTEAFTPKQLDYRTGGPPVREMLYTLEDMRSDFAGAEFVELEELETQLDEGPHHRGVSAVLRAIIRRPS